MSEALIFSLFVTRLRRGDPGVKATAFTSSIHKRLQPFRIYEQMCCLCIQTLPSKATQFSCSIFTVKRCLQKKTNLTFSKRDTPFF